jgi:hypothetical protein
MILAFALEDVLAANDHGRNELRASTRAGLAVCSSVLRGSYVEGNLAAIA